MREVWERPDYLTISPPEGDGSSQTLSLNGPLNFLNCKRSQSVASLYLPCGLLTAERCREARARESAWSRLASFAV